MTPSVVPPAVLGTTALRLAPPPVDPVLRATRESILDVGLRRTTLADVARRAGVSRMTVYRQYGDLDAIVSALLTGELVGAIGVAAAHSQELATARERLVESAVLVVGAVASDPLYRRILDLDPELLLPLVVDRFGSTQRAAIDAVADLVRAGRRDGSVRAGADAPVVARMIVVALQSFVFSVRVLDAEQRRGSTARELRALLTGYLS